MVAPTLVGAAVQAMIKDDVYHLIPVATQPIYMWAKKIRVVLNGRRWVDLSTDEATERFLSPLLSKCPAYLTDIIPKDTLENAIRFLEAWDDTGGTLADGFRETTINSKPSIQFHLNVQSFKTNMPPGINIAEHLNIARALAWEALKRSFPPEFRVYVNLLHISAYPTDQDLKKLNEGWATFNLRNKATINQVAIGSSMESVLSEKAEKQQRDELMVNAINSLSDNIKAPTVAHWIPSTSASLRIERNFNSTYG